MHPNRGATVLPHSTHDVLHLVQPSLGREQGQICIVPGVRQNSNGSLGCKVVFEFEYTSLGWLSQDHYCCLQSQRLRLSRHRNQAVKFMGWLDVPRNVYWVPASINLPYNLCILIPILTVPVGP